MNISVEKRIRLSAERADHLRRIAESHRISEDQLIEKALDATFTLSELFGTQPEHQSRFSLSEEPLARVWDNAEDVCYNNWRDLYDVPSE
jgi:hypothetical protein